MKLVRDKIPEKFPQHDYGHAAGNEYLTLLRMKLMEEAGEVAGARNEREFIEELADVMEVILTLAAMSQIDWLHVESARLEKRHLLGGFEGGHVLTNYNEES